MRPSCTGPIIQQSRLCHRCRHSENSRARGCYEIARMNDAQTQILLLPSQIVTELLISAGLLWPRRPLEGQIRCVREFSRSRVLCWPALFDIAFFDYSTVGLDFPLKNSRSTISRSIVVIGLSNVERPILIIRTEACEYVQAFASAIACFVQIGFRSELNTKHLSVGRLDTPPIRFRISCDHRDISNFIFAKRLSACSK